MGASSHNFFISLDNAAHHLAIEQPLMLQRMGLVHRLAKTVALIRIIMGLDRDAVVLQRTDHIAGLLWHDHGIQFPLKEDHRCADSIRV
ncbi:hypothetical protein PHLH5_49750 [Pseudomonas sp. Cab53]|nr:hypothetical protein PHLH5_49750 [Pseudomonas sp. Cab53]